MIDNPHKLLTEVEDLERKLKDAQARLEAARAAEAELTEEQRLAVELHELTCTANHIDACGWGYEFTNRKHDWRGAAHNDYLTYATRLIHRCGSTEAAWETLKKYRIVKDIKI